MDAAPKDPNAPPVRDIQWYKDAHSYALLIEDWEEAKQLKAKIKEMKAAGNK